MSHKFDAKNKHKLDNETRRKILPPIKTLIDLGLKEGDVMLDIGCGIGYFTFPASELVGAAGKIFAMDISPEMLNEVEKKAELNNSSNIVTILTDENNLKIAEPIGTFAFICNVLHETENKKQFLSEVKRMIADKGRIAVVEWEKKESDIGPPVNHRMDKSEVLKLLSDAGFTELNSINIGEYYYAVTGINKF